MAPWSARTWPSEVGQTGALLGSVRTLSESQEEARRIRAMVCVATRQSALVVDGQSREGWWRRRERTKTDVIRTDRGHLTLAQQRELQIIFTEIEGPFALCAARPSDAPCVLWDAPLVTRLCA